jgi:hypothetical protein
LIFGKAFVFSVSGAGDDLLGSAPQAEQDISGSKAPSDLWLCPKCGGPMMVIERLTAAEIQLRSPPALVTEAA